MDTLSRRVPRYKGKRNRYNKPPLEEQFWSKVDKSGDCWLWNGTISNTTGYGAFYNRFLDKEVIASRFAYELTHGSIPKNLFVCHRCNNPRCVNPAHLYAGTAQDNENDKVAVGHHLLNRPKGENVVTSKLTATQVAEIRKKYSPRGKAGQTLRSLAEEYEVSYETIRLIVSNQMWKE